MNTFEIAQLLTIHHGRNVASAVSLVKQKRKFRPTSRSIWKTPRLHCLGLETRLPHLGPANHSPSLGVVRITPFARQLSGLNENAHGRFPRQALLPRTGRTRGRIGILTAELIVKVRRTNERVRRIPNWTAFRPPLDCASSVGARAATEFG